MSFLVSLRSCSRSGGRTATRKPFPSSQQSFTTTTISCFNTLHKWAVYKVYSMHFEYFLPVCALYVRDQERLWEDRFPSEERLWEGLGPSVQVWVLEESFERTRQEPQGWNQQSILWRSDLKEFTFLFSRKELEWFLTWISQRNTTQGVFLSCT